MIQTLALLLFSAAASAFADSGDVPALPPSAIPQAGSLAAASSPSDAAQAVPAAGLPEVVGAARAAAARSAVEQRALQQAGQDSREEEAEDRALVRAIESVYESAGRLAERYAKDSAASELPTPRWRPTTLAATLTGLVHPAGGSRNSGGGSFHYVYPGTEDRYVGGTNIGGYNAGGMEIGGGSGSERDPGGDLAIALDVANSRRPGDSAWALKSAQNQLSVLRERLKDWRATSPEQAAWIAAAVKDLGGLDAEIGASVRLAQARYLAEERRLPAWKRKLRGFLGLGSP